MQVLEDQITIGVSDDATRKTNRRGRRRVVCDLHGSIDACYEPMPRGN